MMILMWSVVTLIMKLDWRRRMRMETTDDGKDVAVEDNRGDDDMTDMDFWDMCYLVVMRTYLILLLLPIAKE
uniref:Uncharacterized protein n=1 Tax=Fagus sylvatica TaxID=28930 RepID=A0A2N9FTZ9_FAGSY